MVNCILDIKNCFFFFGVILVFSWNFLFFLLLLLFFGYLLFRLKLGFLLLFLMLLFLMLLLLLLFFIFLIVCCWRIGVRLVVILSGMLLVRFEYWVFVDIMFFLFNDIWICFVFCGIWSVVWYFFDWVFGIVFVDVVGLMGCLLLGFFGLIRLMEWLGKVLFFEGWGFNFWKVWWNIWRKKILNF